MGRGPTPFDRDGRAAEITVTPPLYMRVMGDSWTQLAEPVRRLHTTDSILRAHGHFRIEHGRHPLARFVARLLRLPRPSASAEIRLVVIARAGGEHWQRTFNGRRLDTRQYESSEAELPPHHAQNARLAERFGVLELRFRLDASDGSLVYVQREAAFVFGSVRLRIPASWAPRVEAREDPAGGERVKVGVRVALPGVGPFITYDGIIAIEDPRA